MVFDRMQVKLQHVMCFFLSGFLSVEMCLWFCLLQFDDRQV